MNSQNKWDNFYNYIINEKTLSKKLLNSCGFSNEEIKELVDNGIIALIEYGYYNFVGFHNLYEYGKKLLDTNNVNLANSCFSCCQKSGYSKTKIASTLLFHYIKFEDYEKALNYLIELIKSPYNIYLNNNLFYIYLLSFITRIPNEINVLLEQLNFNYKDIDSLTSYEILQNTTIDKDVVKECINQKFRVAYSKNNDIINSNGINYEGLTVKNLLKKINDLKYSKKLMLVDFINNESYEKIVDFYNEQASMHQLGIIDFYIRKLASDLINVNNNRVLIQTDSKEHHNFFRMIDCRDYESALELNQIYQSGNERQILSDPIVLLLQALIVEKQKNKRLFIYDKRNSLTRLFKTLKTGDIQKANIYLHNYLEDINELKYEFLVKGLINLSLLEGDQFFAKPLLYLTSIEDKRYFIKLDNYIDAFNYGIGKNNLEKAAIYLDIICNLNGLSDKGLLSIEQLDELRNRLIEARNQNNNMSVLKLRLEN